MISQFFKPDSTIPGEHVVRRIQWLTIGFGLASAAVALALRRPDWAKGLVSGAVLGWLNFRWLQSGIFRLDVQRVQNRKNKRTEIVVHKMSDWTEVFFHRFVSPAGLAPHAGGLSASHTLAVIIAATSAHNPKPMLTRGTCR